MEKTEQKIVQYLGEAHATEQGLVTMLQSQIAMTPGGSYRDGLESHLRETREHATRVQRRLDELGRAAARSKPAFGSSRASLGEHWPWEKRPWTSCAARGERRKS